MSSHTGRLIVAERARRGLTQEAIADRIGKDHACIGEIERGRRPPAGLVNLIGDAIVSAPQGRPEEDDRRIGRWLRAERLKAGLTLGKIERRIKIDRSCLDVLERGRKPFVGEIFRFLEGIARRKPILMKQLGPSDVENAGERAKELARRLVGCEVELARYDFAGLEPPDRILLERIALRDGLTLCAGLLKPTRLGKKALRARKLAARRRGWRNSYPVADGRAAHFKSWTSDASGLRLTGLEDVV